MLGRKWKAYPMQQNRAFAHQRLWCKIYILPLIFLFVLTPRALVAAPATQTVQPMQGTPVYGLTGTLRAVDIPPAATQLITSDATIYYLVGANPAIEQQLRQLRDRVPPVRVQVWGVLQANTTQLGQPQLVVTGILGPDEAQPTLTPIVITPRPPTVTPMPVPTATPSAAPLWLATYFPNANLAGTPAVTVRVPAVDFSWGAGAPAPELPTDRFSARFEQSVDLAPGFYQLRAQADDGIRVYLNDELLIDEWHLAEPPQYSVGRELAGPTHFVVEYYDAGGLASVRFTYALVDQFPVWQAEYYANISLNGAPTWVQAESRGVNAQISYHWSLASPVPGTIPENNWSARWRGAFAFETGDYIFRAAANDGVRVWLDGHLVIDQWSDGPHQAQTVFRNVGAGQHTVVVEYYERGGIANLKVEWDKIQP